ncbi:bacteriocin [Marinifilum caeruleilacunae]|uniref:HTH domain-containing protein n=1 Tax=Marinifilum caeruleilacunae TaxID=2499076 RepID=A0ABX1WTF2_9BACT|nr:HTH domain-containing protein [Marinifilum caeruleilacunae]NOU59357.1 HTH domain-containing protein [Marinifilum caeruleilacunae]
MYKVKSLDRLKQINDLVREQKTGSPKEFAKKLGISESHLYKCLSEIKEMGLPIAYSTVCTSYYYSEELELEVMYSVKVISTKELKKIEGGFCKNIMNYFFMVAS